MKHIKSKTKPMPSVREIAILFRRSEVILAYDTNSGASIRAKPGTSAEISIREMLDEELLKSDIPDAVKQRIRESTPRLI